MTGMRWFSISSFRKFRNDAVGPVEHAASASCFSVVEK